jgi:hypothetical protein
MAIATISDTIHRFDDSLNASKEAIKTAKRRAQDVLDRRYDVIHRVRRDPVKALALVFGAGIAVGAVAGVVFTRRGCHDPDSSHRLSD